MAAPELAVSLLVAIRVEWMLRRRSLPELAARSGLRVVASQEPVRLRTPADPPLPAWAGRRLALADRVMRRWPFGAPDGRCLRRALLQGHRVRALDPAIRIGVRRGPTGLVAHAWLEFGTGWTVDRDAALYLPLGPVAGQG